MEPGKGPSRNQQEPGVLGPLGEGGAKGDVTCGGGGVGRGGGALSATGCWLEGWGGSPLLGGVRESGEGGRVRGGSVMGR